METFSYNDEFIRKIKDRGIKWVCLDAYDGKKLVPRNNKGADVAKKLQEIKNRLKNLKDGFYIFNGWYSIGRGHEPETFCIKKGRATLDEDIQPPHYRPLPKQKEESPNVLSYAEALKGIKETESLKAKCEALEKENEELRKKVIELNAINEELRNEESEGDFLSEGLPKLLEPVMPMVPAFLDEWFKLKNRKVAIQEAETFGRLAEKGLLPEKGNFSKAFNNNLRQKQVGNNKDRPDANDAEAIEKYCDWLDTLNDSAFEAELNFIAQNHKELFEVIDKVYGEEGEEEKPEQ